MKKGLLKIASVLFACGVIFGMTQCSENATKDSNDSLLSKVETSDEELPNYRYVDMDSVLRAYNLSKDYSEEMLRMQTNFENTARQRETSIQNFATQVQQKLQNNGYLSEASFKQDEQKMNQMQTSAQNELAKMQTSMQNAAMEAQKTLNDSIAAFINEYNSAYGYDAILYKDATLYINPKLDITDEVIAGLNARYNKVKK